MGLFDIFKKKSEKDEGELPPIYSDIHATDNGDGHITLLLSDPASGRTAPFPPIDILLRDVVGIEQGNQQLLDAGAGAINLPIVQNITEDFVEFLGLDIGTSRSIMSEDNLRREGLTYELARKGAMARLRAAVAGLNVEGGGGRYRVTYPQDLDLSASFILISEDWLDLNDIKGDPVFAVGTRVSIHVCGSEDFESLAGLREIAEVMYAEGVEENPSHPNY